MHTFPATTLGQPVQNVAALKGSGAKAIIARSLAGLAAVALLALGGCSTVRLAYNQAPTLAYYWFNDHLSLSEPLAAPFKQDLQAFFQWHRAEELPRYTERLQQWQQLATQDISATQACAQFGEVRAAYLRGVDRALPSLARVAIGLQTPQFEALAEKNAEGNRKFEDEWLKGDLAERQARRLEKAVERYQTLYGRLSAPQRQLLKTHIQQSSFDPKRLMGERQRRQQDLLASLKAAQAKPEQAQATLRSWHNRLMQSPDPAYAAYSKAGTEENCAQFAALHQTTTPEQRAHAVSKLKDYEGDLQALLRAKP